MQKPTPTPKIKPRNETFENKIKNAYSKIIVNQMRSLIDKICFFGLSHCFWYKILLTPWTPATSLRPSSSSLAGEWPRPVLGAHDSTVVRDRRGARAFPLPLTGAEHSSHWRRALCSHTLAQSALRQCALCQCEAACECSRARDREQVYVSPVCHPLRQLRTVWLALCGELAIAFAVLHARKPLGRRS